MTRHVPECMQAILCMQFCSIISQMMERHNAVAQRTGQYTASSTGNEKKCLGNALEGPRYCFSQFGSELRGHFQAVGAVHVQLMNLLTTCQMRTPPCWLSHVLCALCTRLTFQLQIRRVVNTDTMAKRVR